MIVLGYDLETTGLLVDQDRIIEIGAIIYDTALKVPLEIFSSFVRAPGLAPDYISPTGIKAEWLMKYGISLPDAFGHVQRMIAMSDPVAIVAWNGEAFDKPFTIAELRREIIIGHGLETTHWIDPMVDLSFEKKSSSRKLGHVAADHNFLNPFAHRATFDVLTMLQIMDHYQFPEVLARSKLPWIEVRCCVAKPDRQKAKDLRYGWDGDRVMWTKKIKEDAFAREEAAAALLGVKIVRI